MTSMNPGQMEPWQNRPSLIACWNEATHGQNVSGSPITTLQLAMDGNDTANIPVCIPRACRLTRVCITSAVSSFGAGSVTLNMFRSKNCGGAYTGFTLAVPDLVGGLVVNCYCARFDILFDQCDIWFANLTLPSMVIPIFRVLFHFELR
jgi:hypothetical protein